MQIKMRKVLAILACLAMLCTILPMSALMSVSAATTPVLSLNFEDGQTGFDGGSVVAEGPDGSNCLKWTATGGWSAIWRAVSGVEKNTDYVITFKAKASVAGTMGITIQSGDWSNNYYNEKFQTTTAWQEYSITTNVGEYPTSNAILFKFQDQGTAMDLYIDDLVMTKYEEPAPEVPAAENLVVNGSFENGSDSWSLNSAGSIVSGGQDGDYALQMTNPTVGYSSIATQYVEVEPGKTYTLTWWSKRVSGTGVFNFYLDGATYTGQNWMNETSGNWVQGTMELTINATTTRLLLKFSNEAANTVGTILIDNVVLTKNPEASFDGFLYNGDFEIGSLQNWTISQAASVSAAAAHSGNYGAHITNPGGDWGGMIYQGTVGVEAGKTYTVSVWVKVTVGYVNYSILDGSTSGSKLASKGFNSNSWVQFSASVTPTTNVMYLNFNGGGTGTNDQAYVDDVLIIEEKEPCYDGYLYNGDFETGSNAPWTVYTGSGVTTDAAHTGNYGALLTTGNWGTTISQTSTSTLKIGTEYTISFWYKAVEFGNNWKIKGATTGTVYSQGWLNKTEWTQITVQFVADDTSVVLSFNGGAESTTGTIYLDDVSLSRVGGEIYPENLIGFGGASIRDVDVSSTGGTGYGLAFKFDVEANSAQKNFENQYVNGSGKIVLGDTEYTLVRMGAVMTNKADVGSSSANFTLSAVDGKKVIDIQAVYLAGLTAEEVSFAVRILDIPVNHIDSTIYARPYYVYLDGGEEVTVYGNIKSDTYAKVSNPKSSIKILSIGHSFSKDVMETYLWDMFKEGGYDEVVIGYLYMAGCSMPKHLYNIQHNLAQYEYGKNSNGTWTKQYNVSALTALKDEEWDYVNIQSSPDYIGGQEISGFKLGVNGDGDQVNLATPMTEYECITPITDWIKENALNSAVKTDYNMIWAFSEGCDLWSYGYHDNNQLKMYNNIITQTKENVLTNDAVYSVIPCGTSIQNARTSFIGDNFNELDASQGGNDGYHLNTKYGDYTAALTWYCHYSGDDANVMADYIGQLTAPEFEAIAEAVNNAIETWDEITESTHK